MNHISNDINDPITLRLIATALELHQAQGIAASITPLPGIGKYITIGTPAEVARLLELGPAFANGGAEPDWEAYAMSERAVCTPPPPGWYCTRERGHEGPCAAHPAVGEHDHSEGGHHD
jgi:hypothetical protein